jgi:hypothetical protein
MMIVLLLGLAAAMVHKKISLERRPRRLGPGSMDQDQPTRRTQGSFRWIGPGVNGYFSERTVINGDGLVNSWNYQRALQQGRLRAFLRECKVDYLVWNRYKEGRKNRDQNSAQEPQRLCVEFFRAAGTAGPLGACVLIRRAR